MCYSMGESWKNARVKEARPKRTHIVWVHLYTALTILKFIETENRMYLPGLGRGGSGKLSNGSGFSLAWWKVLEMDRGDAYRIVWINLMPFNYTIENSYNIKCYLFYNWTVSYLGLICILVLQTWQERVVTPD